jgi:flagellar biogenesis protein FliO
MLVCWLQGGSSGAPAELPGGYGAALLQSLLALTAVCILAWVVLRWAAQRGFDLGGRARYVRVVERVPLDARRVLWLVQVGGRVLLIGAGDGGSPVVLAELSEKDLPEAPQASSKGGASKRGGSEGTTSFLEVLRRVATRTGEGGGAAGAGGRDENRHVADETRRGPDENR